MTFEFHITCNNENYLSGVSHRTQTLDMLAYVENIHTNA